MPGKYSQRRSGAPLFGIFLISVLISVLAFGIDSLSSGALRSYVRTMGSLAMTAAGNVVTSIDRSGILQTHASLTRENADFKAELARRDESILRFQILESENESLRTLAHLAEGKPGASARVLSSFRASPYGTLVISAGINDGVRIGAIALSTGGFVLGTVSDADVESATVETLFAPEREVELIDGDIAFTVRGRGGGNARAEIPRDAKVAVGDVLVAKEFGYPAGIIGFIESASSSATQTLFIRLPVNLDTLQYVYVAQ